MPVVLDVPTLIAEGASLKSRITADTARLKEIEADLLRALPAGEHQGANGATCRIVTPGPAVKPDAEAVDAVRQVAGDDVFRKLFERAVSFKPVKAFREVLAAITDKRTTAKVLALVERESTPYVKWG
jgi:hypothetical protein